MLTTGKINYNNKNSTEAIIVPISGDNLSLHWSNKKKGCVLWECPLNNEQIHCTIFLVIKFAKLYTECLFSDYYLISVSIKPNFQICINESNENSRLKF